MADYSIPLSGEDSGMLSTIKTSLDSLSSSTETKKANKSVLLGKFQEELSSEVATLKENILNITQVGRKQRKMPIFSNSGDRKSCPTGPWVCLRGNKVIFSRNIQFNQPIVAEFANNHHRQTLERLEKSIEQVSFSV